MSFEVFFHLTTVLALVCAIVFVAVTLLWGEKFFAFWFVNCIFAVLMLVLILTYYFQNGYNTLLEFLALAAIVLSVLAYFVRKVDKSPRK